MKRFGPATILGVALIIFGVLLLLEQMGILRGTASLFWKFLFLAGAFYFLRLYATDNHSRFWAIFPGMAMLGIGLSAFLPSALDGALFLGCISAAFWVIYGNDRSRWWAIIPGGVLLTLAAISVLDHVSGLATGGLFFLGLGLTFVAVALLPGPVNKNQWAFIPGGILLAFGVFLGLGAQVGLMAYFWPAFLIVLGCVLIFFYFFRRG